MICCILLLLTASTAPDDDLYLCIPDISYFPDEPQLRHFTTALITANAYWLVQDTTWFDLPSSGDEFQLVWGNLITSDCVDSIAAEFEGSEGMFNSVIDALGPLQDTGNGDDKIWIVFADIPDYYPVPGSGYQRLRNWLYTWPDDFDGDPLTGNNHDIFYVNLSPYKNQTGGNWDEIKQSIYTWSVASGLGQITRTAANSLEEKWVIRGLGAYTQYLCFGITSELNGAIGIHGYMEDFARSGGIELPSWWSGRYAKDFSANIGGEFLWFQYLAQRAGTGVIETIAQSDLSGMVSIAHALDPSVPLDMVTETVAYPLYEDWIITNLISPFAADYQSGEFHYQFLDGSGYEFTIVDCPASFLAEFDQYPFSTWIAPVSYGISAQEFASQYADFDGDYTSGGDTTVFFNGMYNQNNGSGSNIDGRWTVYRIVLSDDSTLSSVDSLQFDELYNGTFQLEGSHTFLALMCNNPGGTANVRYCLSQDDASLSVFTTFLQNPMHPGQMQVYTSLYREDSQIPYGFDWTGPNIDLSLLNSSGFPDSTATLDMEPLAETLWQGSIEAWSQGSYILASSGYDSLGRLWSDTLACAVDYTGQGSTCVTTGQVSFSVDGASFPTGTIVSLMETDIPPESTISMACISGPVSVWPGGGLLSFTCEESECNVFKLQDNTWIQTDCYGVNGRISAFIDEPGIYMLGNAYGHHVNEIPEVPVINSLSPNPFSSSLFISFSTPAPENISVRMYDLSGRITATVFDGYVTGGISSLLWQEEIPSGVYFVVLQADEASDVRRLVKL